MRHQHKARKTDRLFVVESVKFWYLHQDRQGLRFQPGGRPPDLLDQLPLSEQIGIATSGGAFDSRRYHICLALMKQFNAIGTNEIEYVA